MDKIKLTKLTCNAGCAAKLGPLALSQMLKQLPKMESEKLLVGLETSDDAAVYQISEDKAIISTMDFFTPVVDDPYTFGQIAACNALSDVYAMGGVPLLALNVVVFPDELEKGILREILQGGADKVIEAGAIIGGGHSIRGEEPIYGLSVLGEASPQGVIPNCAAKPGDVLILTKALGIGIATTAIKAGKAPEDISRRAVDVMCTLNKAASEAAVELGVNSMTDITGFGLLGHAAEMAQGSKVTLKIHAHSLPILPGILDLLAQGLLPGGLYRNKEYLREKIYISPEVPEEIADICFDPQTSGGLLISVPREKETELISLLRDKGVGEAAVVGEVLELEEYSILLEP